MLTYIRPRGTKTITENGTVDVSSYMNVEVNVSSGDSGNRSDPIRFFDYDGTLVASYTSVPDSLPNIPIHDRLTNGTWNYTLEQISSQYAAVGTCDIGANYDTASGATEIDITLDSNHLEPWLCVAINGTATVDWGDGSATDSITSTGSTTLAPIQHVYAQAGDYTISINGPIAFYNNSLSYPSVLRSTGDTSGNRQYICLYCDCITAIRVADGSIIGAYAFTNCYNLASISIPSDVTSIGDTAFTKCYNLTSISIPSGVTSIGNNTFSSCYNLTSISIPSGVTNIGNNAFQYCDNLASISIPSNVTSIGNAIFNSCDSLTTVIIPSGVTRISSSMFSSCSRLTSITIPSSITYIYEAAFSSCSSLTAVTIPSNVTYISSYVFANCYSLTSIIIPSSVTSIGSNAFYNCYNVMEYHLLSTTPPTLANTDVFRGITSGTKIYVPTGSLEAYQTATNWSTYADYMIEE